jgi:hypothetical protein
MDLPADKRNPMTPQLPFASVNRRALEEPPGAALTNTPIMTSKRSDNKRSDNKTNDQ